MGTTKFWALLGIQILSLLVYFLEFYRVKECCIWGNLDGTLQPSELGSVGRSHMQIIILPTACHYQCPEICNEFDMQKSRIPLWLKRIKSWNFRSAPNVIVHILKNPVNLYDSNGVISIPISTLGDKKWNLLLFCLPIFPQNPLNAFRIDGEIPETSFTNLNLRGGWSLDP